MTKPTRRTALATLAALSIPAHAASPVPVLVELFTSEGCSSCPPADLLLQVLDKEQPVPGADIIVLSEHVDYWNNIGWADPFSSPAYTRRQQQYARQFALDGVYTPQMVVDGREQFVGSDERRAATAIQTAARIAKPTLTLYRKEGAFHISTPQPLPADMTITVVLAREQTISHVLRGENNGSELRHVAVVTKLIEAGRARKGQPLNVTVPNAPDLTGLRALAFAQDSRTGHIAAACRLTQA